MVISLKNFGGKDCTTFLFIFLNFDLNEESYLLIYFIFVNGFFSTKDPGQEPFSFKIGQGSVIKGNSTHFVELHHHVSYSMFCK